MLRFSIIILMLNFYTPTFSFSKEKIISQMEAINILSFDFIQMTDGKKETGSCIIKYPKKIYCEYNNYNKKIIISNGRSLVIKNKNSISSYKYSLKKTPLEFLLDKDYLISKIRNLEPKKIDNKFFVFKIFENDNDISIFFDLNTFILTGWQTEDIYQNLIITYISSIKINQNIDSKIFILPKNN